MTDTRITLGETEREKIIEAKQRIREAEQELATERERLQDIWELIQAQYDIDAENKHVEVAENGDLVISDREGPQQGGPAPGPSRSSTLGEEQSPES